MDDYCLKSVQEVYLCKWSFLRLVMNEFITYSISLTWVLKSRSQSFHITTDLWLLQSTVIVQWYLKQRRSLLNLLFCVYYCKIANILYFQLLCFVICSFFKQLTCTDYASVTALALGWKIEAISSGLMIQHVINRVTETRCSWLGSEASHKVIFHIAPSICSLLLQTG